MLLNLTQQWADPLKDDGASVTFCVTLVSVFTDSAELFSFYVALAGYPLSR